MIFSCSSFFFCLHLSAARLLLALLLSLLFSSAGVNCNSYAIYSDNGDNDGDNDNYYYEWNDDNTDDNNDGNTDNHNDDDTDENNDDNTVDMSSVILHIVM